MKHILSAILLYYVVFAVTVASLETTYNPLHAGSDTKEIPIGTLMQYGRVSYYLATGDVRTDFRYSAYNGETLSAGVLSVLGPVLDGFTTAAECRLNSAILQTGWHILDLVTGITATDEQQAFGAGLCEGTVSALYIHQHFNNTSPKNMIPAVLKFFDDNRAWMDNMIAMQRPSSPEYTYWHQIKLVLMQIDGMLKGVNSVSSIQFSYSKLMLLVGMGDLFDLKVALQRGRDHSSVNVTKDWRKMSKSEFITWIIRNTHCSALIKVTDNLDDLFFGHVSWFDYTATLRIFKRITLNYHGIRAKYTAFSSYPGMISSFDDFYVTDANLAVIETSLSVFNHSVYDGTITPKSILYALRVISANRMSPDAPSWTEWFTKYNSGTYNNQWIVVDLNLFTPREALKPNTIWIAEQMPGLVKSRDVTDILSYGYFPSYNVPLDPEVYQRLGYPETVILNGPEQTSYQMCVRAQIFRRDQGTVKDMTSFQHILQYNNYETDPISEDNPNYAISNRADLPSPVNEPICFGAYDAKTSSYKLWMTGGKNQTRSKSLLAHSGPTPQQKLFDFSTTKAQCPRHVGLPPRFDFGWYDMDSEQNKNIQKP